MSTGKTTAYDDWVVIVNRANDDDPAIIVEQTDVDDRWIIADWSMMAG